MIPEVVRPDRDESIEFLSTNVVDTQVSNFVPLPASILTTTTPFDYGSVTMMAPIGVS